MNIQNNKLIKNDIESLIKNNSDSQLYIYNVFLEKSGYSIDYSYILKSLLKKKRIKTICKLCELTHLNKYIKSNISYIKKYITDETDLNVLIKKSSIICNKNKLPILNWDTYHMYLITLTNLQTSTKAYPYLILEIVKNLNFYQTDDCNILYMFYEMLNIHVKHILKITFTSSNIMSSEHFKFNTNYCFNILQKNNQLFEIYFYYFQEHIINNAFNYEYSYNFQDRSIFHQLLNDENDFRNTKKQRTY